MKEKTYFIVTKVIGIVSLIAFILSLFLVVFFLVMSSIINISIDGNMVLSINLRDKDLSYDAMIDCLLIFFGTLVLIASILPLSFIFVQLTNKEYVKKGIFPPKASKMEIERIAINSKRKLPFIIAAIGFVIMIVSCALLFALASNKLLIDLGFTDTIDLAKVSMGKGAVFGLISFSLGTLFLAMNSIMGYALLRMVKNKE